MIKFKKYELSAFTGKKHKFGQKERILRKNKNSHEIQKNGLCPCVNIEYKGIERPMTPYMVAFLGRHQFFFRQKS